MIYVLLTSELESFDRVRGLALKLSKDRERQKREMKDIENRQMKYSIKTIKEYTAPTKSCPAKKKGEAAL